ncbi:hypothetical protein [Naumannella huperziae]
MKQVLEARKDHRPPIAGIVILAAVTIGVLAYGRLPGWWQAAIVVVVLAALYAAFKWVQARTTVTLDGATIRVHSPVGGKEVAGAEIVAVRELPNGRSPNHLLRTADGRRLLVPSSEVRRGHSALFRWLDEYAPAAELDKRSTRTRRLLADRGQLDPAGPGGPEDG